MCWVGVLFWQRVIERDGRVGAGITGQGRGIEQRVGGGGGEEILGLWGLWLKVATRGQDACVYSLTCSMPTCVIYFLINTEIRRRLYF